MKPLNEYTRESIMNPSVFEEIFKADDLIYRSQLIASFSMRARELRVKSEFDRLLRAYEMKEKQKRLQGNAPAERWTNFSGKYNQMKCGQWIADDDGIRLYNLKSGSQDIVACHHPILPVRRLINLQTDEEQITLAFMRNGIWKEITVPKTTIAKKSLITGLAAKSVLVTDDNAALLVRYLADIEAENEANIPLALSSSKLGWINGTFLPYDDSIAFDGDAKFRQSYKSIQPHGDRDTWYEHVKSLRATGRFEILFVIAASFASVLLGIVGGLPFIVDLWGESGSGKTVALMVAASTWANPGKGLYIRDYSSTDVGLEALADFLNHLPVILDDTSKRNKMNEQRFEEIVYNLCSGKGKTRSNKDLGINRESVWENIVLTNGEKPVTSYVMQGGALNRVLEIESQMDLFLDPQKTADIVKKSYGHAGKDFVDVVKRIGFEEVKRIQKEFQKEIFKNEKAQKQSISLSIVLTADKIATDYLFEDGIYISLDDAIEVLITQDELSDNERCYQYIVDKVGMNAIRFDGTTNVEKWGIIENGYVVFFIQALEELCRQGGFSRQSFVSWARKNELIQIDSSGKSAKVKRVNGKSMRCIHLKLPDEEDVGRVRDKQDDSKFANLDAYGQEELPFE